MRKLCLLGALVFAIFYGPTSYAQDFSNKGKEFWLAYCYHVGMVNTPINQQVMTLYMTSDQTTTYTVEIYGVTTISTGTINAGAVVSVIIPTTYVIDNDGLFNNKAVHITAAKNIAVYAYETKAAVSGATLCLPVPVLGKEYFSANFTQVSNENNANSYFTIVAIEDNTTVEITPKVATKGGWAAGSLHTITLNKGQVYQVLGTTTGLNGTDLTGSYIKSVSSGSGGCKRIAVFSGSGKIRIPGSGCSNNTSDNLYQQLYPVASWGKNYLTVPSYNRINNYYRIIRSVPTANVYVNGALIPSASFTNEYYQFFSSTANNITSDQPIAVLQYFTTQNCDGNGNPYDPDMIALNPIEQNISDVTLVSSNMAASPPQHHIHVIMKNTGTGISSFRIDGLIPGGTWTVHPNNPAYSYLYLANVTQGYHRLRSDSGFLALAYGYAPAESYAYSAGANVKDLYQYVTIQNQYATVNFPATCKNTPFQFSMTFPYQPTEIHWIFGPALNAMGILDVDLINPTPTATIVVNGKTLYVYQLPLYYTITASGTYTIQVNAVNPTSDGCGGLQEISYDLQVFDPPTADFTFSDVCLGQNVLFFDNSNTGGRPVISRYWEFGDATTGNTYNPAHLYAAAGAYNVRYSLITDIGCLSDTAAHIVNVNPLPVASISGTTSVCLNAPPPDITFTGSGSTAPYTFTYNINGGPDITITSTGNTATVSVPTNTAGTYTYTLVSVLDASTTLCSQVQTGSATVTVNPLPTATISGNTEVCENATPPVITFTGGGGAVSPYTFTYTINGGPNQTVTSVGNTATVSVPTTPAGTYTYTLVSVQDASTTLCSQAQSGSVVVTVNPLPTAIISGTTEVCKNSTPPTITFTGGGSTAPYLFTYNINGGPNQTVTSTGNTATVTVPTTTTGTFIYNLVSVQDASTTICSQLQSGSVTVIVHPLPTNNFSFTIPSCETRTISFTDLSVPNVGTLTSWTWDFGDGSSPVTINAPSSPNITHTYASAGVYPVSLVVTNSKGCVSVGPPINVTIHARPKAGYIIPDVCLSDTYAQFTDTSTVASPDVITTWHWDFGDPSSGPSNTSTLQNPQHSYTATGTYNVQLIVTSNNGCKDTITQVLSVNGSFPVSDFNVQNPSTLCANDSVAIADASTVFPGNITKIEIYWDNVGQPAVFDIDNTPVSGRIYKHLYPNFQSPLTKTFTIRYRAYSGGVCVNDKFRNVTVNAAPKVQFNNMPAVCLDANPFQITQASEIGGVPGSGVYSGPGVSPTGIFNPSVAGAGTHTIMYTFTSSAAGCKDSMSNTIVVWEPPVANFSASTPACETKAITFTDNSNTPVGTLTTWTWDFADGSPLVIRNNNLPFTHIFANWGVYNVKLFVTTSNNCKSAFKIIPVSVHPQPQPNFTTPPSSCLPNASVLFTNTSTIADGSQALFTYLWDFGDGSGTSTQANPTHVYTTTGPFNVNLQVTSNNGCVASTTIPLTTVHPQPLASFTVDKIDVCIGSSVTFTDNSNPLGGSITQYNWTMGDGNTRNTPTFNYTYAAIGSYDVEHFIFNSFGCRSTDYQKTISVNPYPPVNAGPDKFVLQGGQVMLTPVLTATMPVTYLWTPQQYLSNPTIPNTIASPPDDITYMLKITTDKGCSDSDYVFIKVLKLPSIPNIFSPNGDGIHDKWVIQYLESYPGCTVDIFNRYGQRLYHSEGYSNPWDGTVNGKPVPVGTYYYIVDPKNGRKLMSGYVDIVR